MTTAEPFAFGTWLRIRREAAGLTQEALAEQAGLQAKTVAALERGRRQRPYAHTIRALATALGISDDEQAALLTAVAERGPRPGRSSARPVPTFPEARTPLIGRDGALADLLDILHRRDSRLVTLTGPGGVGKTSLALEAARSATDEFPDGIVLVPLETLSDPTLVLSRIGAGVGLTSLTRGSEPGALCGYLQDRRVLLILDNFEHLLDAGADVAHLIAMNSGLTVLATSRAPLRLRVEREYPLGPLAVPAMSRIPTPDEIVASGAVQLFVDRARASSPAFALTEANAAAVAAICRRLDGLPLAIELAAARLRVLSPTEVLARLDQSLPLLTGGARDLPERQRTIRQAIEWSYRILLPEEQKLFRWLSVFTAGWDAAAAEAVGGQGPDTRLDALSALVEHSLVIAEPLGDGSTRYRMLEMIRQFGNEQLAAVDGIGPARDAHLCWTVSMAERASAHMMGSEQARWLEHLEREHGNLHSALSWALESPDPNRHEEGLRLAAALWSFWYLHGHIVEGEAWLQRVLAETDQRPTAARAKALFALGMLLSALGDVVAAVAAHQASLQAARQSSSLEVEALAHFGLGAAIRKGSDLDRADQHFQLALELFQELGDQAWAGITLNGRAAVALRLGALEQAEQLARDGLRLLQSCGDVRNAAEAAIFLGEVARAKGELARAATYLRAALTACWDIGDQFDVMLIIGYLAGVAADSGQLEAAAELAGAASAAHEELLQHRGDLLLTWVGKHVIPETRSRLGDAAFDRAFQDGHALALDAAVSEALALAQVISGAQTPAPVETTAYPAGLTAREVEVLRLVAAGMTNAQVAERLSLSRRTVDAHMRRIYDKLGLGTRAEAIRFAVARGID